MTFKKLSPKQKKVFHWCYQPGSYALICDGSVRSGKTAAMSCSFVLWAMTKFSGENFGICGNTVQAVERNIIAPLSLMVDITYYFKLKYVGGNRHLLTVSGNGRENYFYLFGGKDEASYKLIQGITLAGVFFDEVALMPESFVNQAIARTLSISDSKLWFSCNPDSPAHWFYKDWILKAAEKNALRIQFEMRDNPMMTPEKIKRTKSLYSGVFYERYVLGRWVMAEGLVYTMFRHDKHIGLPEQLPEGDWFISIDYGTRNPTSMGLWLLAYNGQAYRVRESYYDSRREGMQRTDEEHYAELVRLAGDVAEKVNYVVVDPSAASFIECIRRHGLFRIRKADNSVIDGIRDVGTLLQMGALHFAPECKDTIREFGLYSWDTKKSNDIVIKENDHAMDDIRYFVRTAMLRTLREIRREDDFGLYDRRK